MMQQALGEGLSVEELRETLEQKKACLDAMEVLDGVEKDAVSNASDIAASAEEGDASSVEDK